MLITLVVQRVKQLQKETSGFDRIRICVYLILEIYLLFYHKFS